MRRYVAVITLAGATVAGASTPSLAATITLTDSFSVEAEEHQSPSIYYGTWDCWIEGVEKVGAPCEEVLTFDLFDPSLGTLDAVDFSIDATLTWSVFSDPDPGGIDAGVWDTSGVHNYPLGISHTSPGSGVDSLVDTTSVPAGDLYKFLGLGTFDLAAEVFGSSSLTSEFSSYGLLEGEFSVAYTYTPPPPAVPEPATLLLLGTGLGGLVARRRLRRRT